MKKVLLSLVIFGSTIAQAEGSLIVSCWPLDGGFYSYDVTYEKEKGFQITEYRRGIKVVAEPVKNYFIVTPDQTKTVYEGVTLKLKVNSRTIPYSNYRNGYLRDRAFYCASGKN